MHLYSSEREIVMYSHKSCKQNFCNREKLEQVSTFGSKMPNQDGVKHRKT